MTAWWRTHRKAVVAALGAVLTLAAAAAPANKWVGLAVAVATALGVYAVRNGDAPAPVTPVPAKPAAKPVTPPAAPPAG